MATPDKVGAGEKFAIVGGSGKTWGTAQLALTTGAGFRPLSREYKDEPIEIPDLGYNADTYQRQSALVGRRAPAFDIELDATYEGVFGLMCALLMGTDTKTGASPYLHTMYRAVDRSGIMGTHVWYDSQMAHEFDSFKVTSGKFTGKPGEVLQAAFHCEARSRSENATSPVANGTSSIGNLTETGTLTRVQWVPSVLTAKLIAQGGALAAQEILDFELNIDHPVETGPETYSSATVSGGTFRREMNNLRAKTMLKLTIPMQSTAFWTACLAGTIYQVEIKYNAGASSIFAATLPSWKVAKHDSKTNEVGMRVATLEGPCEVPVSAPAGISQAIIPPYIELTNTISAAYV